MPSTRGWRICWLPTSVTQAPGWADGSRCPASLRRLIKLHLDRGLKLAIGVLPAVSTHSFNSPDTEKIVSLLCRNDRQFMATQYGSAVILCKYKLVTQNAAYNEAFWMATAAAAPVIALATVVLLADTQKLLDLSDKEQKYLSSRYVSIPILLISLNAFSQTVVMIFALASLARHRDSGIIISVIILEAAGMVLVFSIAFINVLGRYAARKAKSKASENTGDDNDSID